MLTLLLAALGGGLLITGLNNRFSTPTVYQRHEQHKDACARIGAPEPTWGENAAYYQAGVDSAHLNANAMIGIGVLLLLTLALG